MTIPLPPLRITAQESLMSLGQHIEITPGIAGGKPRIAGHRITVQDIVIWHERLVKGVDEIAAEYDLEISDVYAALSYYFDHRQEIDEALRASEAFVEKLRQETPSKLWKKLQARGLQAQAELGPPMPGNPSAGTWLAEIERRGRAALAGEPGLPWEDVRADIRRRFVGGC